MTKKILKSTIDKFVAFMEDLRENQENGFPYSANQLMKMHRVSRIAYSVMDKLNFVERSGKDRYIVNYRKVEPIMARKLIEHINTAVRLSSAKPVAQKTKTTEKTENEDSNSFNAYCSIVKILFPKLPDEKITRFDEVAKMVHAVKKKADKPSVRVDGNDHIIFLKKKLKQGVIAIEINHREQKIKELTAKDLTL